jgi:hypothetical protein
MNSKAVYLWSNRAFYQQIVVQKVPSKPTQIDMPSLSSSEITKQSHKDFYTAQSEPNQSEANQPSIVESKLQELEASVKSQEQARSNHITLSDQPYSKWQAIFNLD